MKTETVTKINRVMGKAIGKVVEWKSNEFREELIANKVLGSFLILFGILSVWFLEGDATFCIFAFLFGGYAFFSMDDWVGVSSDQSRLEALEIHQAYVSLPRKELQRICRLLEIRHGLDRFSEAKLQRLGAKSWAEELIYSATFKDGSHIYFVLRSDSEHYWDDVTWMSADRTKAVRFDPAYELDDLDVEIGEGDQAQRYSVRLYEC